MYTVGIALKHSETCCCKATLRTWYELITFAEKYGWTPAGTLNPHDCNPKAGCDGYHKLPQGQIVSAEDARAFSEERRYALRLTTTSITSGARDEIEEARQVL